MEEQPITFNPPATADLVDVNFDFLSPRSEFDQSIRPFIYELFDSQCPIAGLADYIANQTEIGTFIVTDSSEKPEDSIISFITLVPSLPSPPLNYAHIYLGAKGDISILINQRWALLICERVVNLPSELIPHLHNQLVLDLNWAEQNCEGRFEFDYIVSLSKCISTVSPAASARKKRKTVMPDNLLLFKLEDEILLKYAEESFLFESEASRAQVGKSSAMYGDDSCSHKLVIILSKAKYLQAVQEIGKAFSNPS